MGTFKENTNSPVWRHFAQVRPFTFWDVGGNQLQYLSRCCLSDATEKFFSRAAELLKQPLQPSRADSARWSGCEIVMRYLRRANRSELGWGYSRLEASSSSALHHAPGLAAREHIVFHDFFVRSGHDVQVHRAARNRARIRRGRCWIAITHGGPWPLAGKRPAGAELAVGIDIQGFGDAAGRTVELDGTAVLGEFDLDMLATPKSGTSVCGLGNRPQRISRRYRHPEGE